MKKRTKTAVTVVFVLLGFAVVPTAASGHKLSMYYARSAATSVALDWSFADPNNTDLWVNSCFRYSQHKVSCDANVESTRYGTLHCGTYSCSETDTITTCWKSVYALLSGRYKVRYRVGPAHCTSRSSTTHY